VTAEEFQNYDTRNVVDKYKGWPEEEIRMDLQLTHNGFEAWFINLTGDFNKATGVRNANAFNATAVHFFGDKQWDRRGAVGTHNYTDVFTSEYSGLPDAIAVAKGLGWRVVGVDNGVENAVALPGYEWCYNTVMIFGEERAGIAPEILDLCDDVVYIPQYGSVRSLNVGTASGIIMYDYTRMLWN